MKNRHTGREKLNHILGCAECTTRIKALFAGHPVKDVLKMAQVRERDITLFGFPVLKKNKAIPPLVPMPEIGEPGAVIQEDTRTPENCGKCGAQKQSNDATTCEACASEGNK